jgi:hypothetical protein
MVELDGLRPVVERATNLDRLGGEKVRLQERGTGHSGFGAAEGNSAPSRSSNGSTAAGGKISSREVHAYGLQLL